MISASIRRFDTVTSTNDIALEAARAGAPEGTVFLARSQSAGRGRRRRAWLDERGACVLMSAVLRPDLPSDRIHELSFVASAAAAGLLESAFGLEPALKWPNDVLVRDRKIAGILIEAAQDSAVAVGIGLNVNQTSFPSEIAETATSVAIETGSSYDVDAVGESLASALFSQYETYLAHGFEEILTHWRKYMWGIGRQAEVEVDEQALSGIVIGVDSTGALLLRDSSGREVALRAGVWNAAP